MLAERIDGESRVKFTNDSKAREFDAVGKKDKASGVDKIVDVKVIYVDANGNIRVE